MKTSVLLIAGVGILLAFPQPTLADLNDGLAAHYPFNGTANDESGNGHHGTVIGATLSEDRFGNVASAYGFDGQNDYILIGQEPNFPSWASHAVSVWFRNDGGGSHTGYGQHIISKATFYSDFYSQVYASTGAVLFCTSMPWTCIYDGEHDYRDSEWHHLVMNRSGTSGEMWVDGELVGTSNLMSSSNNSVDITVGYTFHADSWQRRYWSGQIDDIRIYDRILTESEVQSLYLEEPVDPRSAGFWKHQCRDLGFQQVSSQELDDLFADVGANSGAFTECAPIGCTVLDFEPPQNEMRPKTERQTLALWLNVASGRLPSGTPIDLPGLTSATTVGEAIAEIETTLCDLGAERSELELAKDIAEALNLDGEDMELASLTSSLAARPGKTVTITLGLVNMSPYAESYSLTTSGPWSVSLSQQSVTGLGSGQVAVLTANVYVPDFVSAGQRAQIQVTAQDLFSEVGLQREAVIDFKVLGRRGGHGPRKGVQYQLRPDDDE